MATSTLATTSTARATAATTGQAEPSRLRAHTTCSSTRPASTRLTTAAGTTADQFVAWLAGSSAGCLLGWYPRACYTICPKGWTLPSRTQFNVLMTSGLSGSNFMNAPYYLLRGGYVGEDGFDSANVSGIYWSSNATLGNNSFTLLLSTNYISTDSWGTRSCGMSVRCVAAS